MEVRVLSGALGRLAVSRSDQALVSAHERLAANPAVQVRRGAHAWQPQLDGAAADASPQHCSLSSGSQQLASA